VIVIPTLNPDQRLLDMVGGLQQAFDPCILIVDDGSGAASSWVFNRLSQKRACVILHHPWNLGKGAALKTAIRWATTSLSGHDLITADDDLQHHPHDVYRVALTLAQNPGSLILGTRDLTLTQVPLRSRWGNRLTRLAYKLRAGVLLADTQTGLRGIPARYLNACVELPGDHFDYEMNMLLAAARDKWPIIELPVGTVYQAANQDTHFSTLHDSLRVCRTLLRPGAKRLNSQALASAQRHAVLPGA
jgi:glycosyltransferase involved in cell wall biosynthesis